jgi:hypothetical protein
MELILLQKGDRGFYITKNWKMYFPDRNCPLREGLITDVKVTLDKGTYAFFSAKNVLLSSPSAKDTITSIVNICKQEDTDLSCIVQQTFLDNSYYELLFTNNRDMAIGCVDGEFQVLSNAMYGSPLTYKYLFEEHYSLFNAKTKGCEIKLCDLLVSAKDMITPLTKDNIWHIASKVSCLDEQIHLNDGMAFVSDRYCHFAYALINDYVLGVSMDRDLPGFKIGKDYSDEYLKAIKEMPIGFHKARFQKKEEVLDCEIKDVFDQEIAQIGETYSGNITYAYLLASKLNRFCALTEEKQKEVLDFIFSVNAEADKKIRAYVKKGINPSTLSELNWRNQLTK